MGQKVGAAVPWLHVLITQSNVTCLNYTVKMWTVITNPNRNRSLSPVLIVHISTSVP